MGMRKSLEKIVPYLEHSMKILHPTSIVENENLKNFFKIKNAIIFNLDITLQIRVIKINSSLKNL